MIRRPDIVIYNKTTETKLIVECKAPSVKITQKTVDRIISYNMAQKADYLVVTNGFNYYYHQVSKFNQEHLQINPLKIHPDILPLSDS